jgi:hypothetical protein
MRSNRGGVLGAILVILLVVALVGVNVFQFFFWKNSSDTIVKKYEEDITALESMVKTQANLVDVYTVKDVTYPGQVIRQTDLVPAKIPADIVNTSYILDPSSVVGGYYKIALSPGAPITVDVITKRVIDDTSRYVDMIVDYWPVGLKVGDYVDIEITYPRGEVYTVITHKRIEEINASTLRVVMTGLERHIYSGMLVDYFVNSQNGAAVSAVKYVEPWSQKPAQEYYAVPENIVAMITLDPNIVTKVDSALIAAKRGMLEQSLELLAEGNWSALTQGRGAMISQINGATKDQLAAEKSRLEKEAYEAMLRGESTTPEVDTTVPEQSVIVAPSSPIPIETVPTETDNLPPVEGVIE